MRKETFYSTNEDVDRAFDEMKRELGRTPTRNEFRKKYGGANHFLLSGKYIIHDDSDRKIIAWDQYLEHRGTDPSDISHTPEKTDQAFDELMAKLGRVPTRIAFEKEYSGKLHYITSGGYNQKITTWNQYLEHRRVNLNNTPLTNEKIDKAFDELMAKLGRVPKTKEFMKIYGGVLGYLRSGKYDPEIRTWRQYAEHRTLSHEKVDKEFDDMTNELGRRPTSKEFDKTHGRALDYILRGKYDPEIRTWGQYLEYRNLDTTVSWTPEKVDQVFDRFRDELGRVPTYLEFNKEHGGALRYITRGDYNESITKYTQYLTYRGLARETPIKTPEQLQDLLKSENLDVLASVATDGRYASDVAGILKQMFPDRIKDEAGLTRLLVSSTIGDAVYPFSAPNGWGTDRPIHVPADLPDNIKQQLAPIIFKISVEHFQPRFNKDPRTTLKELEEASKVEDPFARELMTRTRRFYEELFDLDIPGIGKLSSVY